MRKHKFLRRALAVLAACLLLGAACLAGLAKALPDTFYIDGALTDLKIAAMPFLSIAQPRQGSVAADNAVADKSGNVTLTLLGLCPSRQCARSAPHTARCRSVVRRLGSKCSPMGH